MQTLEKADQPDVAHVGTDINFAMSEVYFTQDRVGKSDQAAALLLLLSFSASVGATMIAMVWVLSSIAR